MTYDAVRVSGICSCQTRYGKSKQGKLAFGWHESQFKKTRSAIDEQAWERNKQDNTQTLRHSDIQLCIVRSQYERVSNPIQYRQLA